MEVIIKDKNIKVDKKDDRFFKAFTPKDKFEIIKIPHTECYGNTKIKNIQIEEGSSPTFFVQPKSTQHTLSGLFKGLRDLNIQISDKESDFWSKLQMNNKAMLREFGDGEMKSAIAQSAKSIISQIESLDKKTESRFQQTDTSFLAQVSNLEEQLNSKIQLTKEGVLSQVEDSNKDMKSTLQQQADSILLEVVEKNAATESMLRSELSAQKDGILLQLYKLQENFEARLSVTEKGIEQAVTKEKVQAIIRNSGDSITSAIMDKGKDIKSIINQSTDGTYIGGKQLTIDADTYIRSGVIKSAHIEDGAITNAKIGNLTFDWAVGKTLNAQQVNVVNLDASNITTGKLLSTYLKVVSDFEMMGNAIRFTNNGNLSTVIDREKIHFYDQVNGARKTGSMGATRLAAYQDVSFLNMVHEKQSYLSIDYMTYGTDGSTSAVPYLVFDKHKINPFNGDLYNIRVLEDIHIKSISKISQKSNWTSGTSALGMIPYTDRVFIGNTVTLTGLMWYPSGEVTVMQDGKGKYNLHMA